LMKQVTLALLLKMHYGRSKGTSYRQSTDWYRHGHSNSLSFVPATNFWFIFWAACLELQELRRVSLNSPTPLEELLINVLITAFITPERGITHWKIWSFLKKANNCPEALREDLPSTTQSKLNDNTWHKLATIKNNSWFRGCGLSAD
jgi:hypothetical protein